MRDSGRFTRTDRPNKNVPQVRMLKGKGVNMGNTEGLHPRPNPVPVQPKAVRKAVNTIPAFKRGGMVGGKTISCKNY